MGTVKVNLDTLVSKYIHRPIVKEDSTMTPLYARVGKEYESALDIKALENPLWRKASETTYNSPTNVRRLFIGDKGVTIQYYKPPVGMKHCWLSYSYKSDDNIAKMAFNITNINKIMMQASMDNTEVEKYVLTKTGLGAISKDWVMSNIEEIYVTPSILLSEDIQMLFGEEANTEYRILTMSGKTGIRKKTELGQRIFEQSNSGNVKNIRNRFPRLRTIALMSNIDSVIDMKDSKNLREGLPKSLKDVHINWYEHVGKLGYLNAANISVSQIPIENQDVYKEFQTRPGIYKFDAMILDSYFSDFKQEMLNIARSARDKAVQEAKGGIEKTVVTENIEKSEYEKELDTILRDKGEAFVGSLLRIVFARASMDAINDEFNKMSSEGKAKYRQLLGR